ncbi:MAG: 3-phosphoglycerate dehydrogenase family protein [Acutalibacteraceae bacterium]|nr:3-phosphoglycerate dehydrogenase family protein [Acutalibacteraceae bacterium]
MYNIKTLNKISPAGLDNFDRSKYTYGDDIASPDAIMVRSASMHDMEMPESLKAIARAGAGVNNIPLDKCSEQGIVVFNTPGANANAVKELVLAGLLLASRKVVAGIDWAKTLKGNGDEVGKMVEKGKSAFAGPEIAGKTLGVVGLGAIGILVANAARALGMNVYGYDPYLSVDAAWSLSRSVVHAKSLKEIYANCDYITVHVPLNSETKEMICEESIATMKDGVRILNFSRGALVASKDIIKALESGKVAAYVTDFPSDDVIGVDGVIAIPHLGASTPESEDNCAFMAANEIIGFLENGSIKNSVNMPNVELGDVTGGRICVIHKNVPNLLTSITGVVSAANINIENMVNKSRGDYAYSVIDTADKNLRDVVAKITDITDVVKAWSL